MHTKKKTLVKYILIIISTLFIVEAVNFIANFKFGKSITLVVSQGEIMDYNSIETYTKWFTEERIKMVEYMKENNYKLIEGTYEFNQATTFEEALKIFKFENTKSKEKSLEDSVETK
jgi:hypothetical protein